MVEEPVEEVTYEEVMKAMNKMKLGKAVAPAKVNANMIMASGKFGVIIKRLCLCIIIQPQENKYCSREVFAAAQRCSKVYDKSG